MWIDEKEIIKNYYLTRDCFQSIVETLESIFTPQNGFKFSKLRCSAFGWVVVISNAKSSITLTLGADKTLNSVRNSYHFNYIKEKKLDSLRNNLDKHKAKIIEKIFKNLWVL